MKNKLSFEYQGTNKKNKLYFSYNTDYRHFIIDLGFWIKYRRYAPLSQNLNTIFIVYNIYWVEMHLNNCDASKLLWNRYLSTIVIINVHYTYLSSCIVMPIEFYILYLRRIDKNKVIIYRKMQVGLFKIQVNRQKPNFCN